MRLTARRLLIALTLMALMGVSVLPASGTARPSAGGSEVHAGAAAKKKSKKKAKKCKKGFKRVKGKCKRAKTKPKAAKLNLTPRDYTQIKGLSQPTFKEFVEEKMLIPMPDGEEIYIEVTRPKAEGRYPVVFESSVYHGTLYGRDGTRILPQPTDAEGKPLGLKGFFPPRGYAVVMMDLRGTGRSTGCLDHFGKNDASDIKTSIEWAASQAWSNGSVGITGHSYLGGTTNVAGGVAPKGLKTIVPSAGLAQAYDHQFQAGVPYFLQWLGLIEAYEQLAIERKLPPGLEALPGGVIYGTGDDFGNNPQDTGCGLPQSAAVAGEAELSGQYVQYFKDRDYRAALEKADIPVFMIHGTNDEAARIAGMEYFNRRGSKSTDKIWLGAWDHGIGCCPNQRGIQWPYALLAWFDKQLKGKNVDTGPPVEIFLNDSPTDTEAIASQKEIFTSAGFPGNVKPLLLNTSGTGDLVENGASAGQVSFRGDAQGFVNPDDTGSATFVSKPFENDVVIAGLPKLELSSSQTVERLHMITTLYSEDADGQRRRVTQCSINPELRDGLEKLTPVIPLARMDYEPPCFTVAFKIRKGTKLILRVTTSDPDKVPMFAEDPNVTVFSGGEGTKITLPVQAGATLYPDQFKLDQAPDTGSTGRRAQAQASRVRLLELIRSGRFR